MPVCSYLIILSQFPVLCPSSEGPGPGLPNPLSRLLSAALSEFIQQPRDLGQKSSKGVREEGGQLPLLIITALLTRLSAPVSGQRNYQTNINILEQSLHTNNHQGDSLVLRLQFLYQIMI